MNALRMIKDRIARVEEEIVKCDQRKEVLRLLHGELKEVEADLKPRKVSGDYAPTIDPDSIEGYQARKAAHVPGGLLPTDEEE